MKSRNVSVILTTMVILPMLASCAPAAPTAATEPAAATPTSKASAVTGEPPAGAPRRVGRW